jgi:hypothetical protein
MKKLFITGAILLASFAAHAEGDYKPFFMFDVNSEKDEKHSQTTGETVSNIARDYIGANLTVGVKGPNKMEYSVKAGVSQKDESGTQTISNNIELKIKKSYKLTDTVSPYAAFRLGEKMGKDANHFTHFAIDDNHPRGYTLINTSQYVLATVSLESLLLISTCSI